MPAAKKEAKKKAVTNEVVTREYTINVHKRIHGMYVDFIFIFMGYRKCFMSLVCPVQYVTCI